MITAELLTRISLFAKVPDNERASLASRAADIRLRKDEWLLVEGQAPAFFGLLDGRIDVFKNVGGRDQRVSTYGPGDYFGEVPLLLGSPAIASLQATEPARLMRLEPADFLYLVSHCPVMSSEITKTMAARVGRISQLAVDSQGPQVTVLGHAQDSECYKIREFLSSNRIGFIWRQPDNGSSNGGGAAAPVVVLADGSRLEAPSLRSLAKAVGLQTEPRHDSYDVVIVGGGPAGLAAAVYGASEGLRTLLVERTACGGQAGTSSRIENYLGFPGGLGGNELSERACRQALRFGAELVVSRPVERLDPADIGAEEGACHTVVLEEDIRISAQTVILATGVEWRRLSVPGIERLVGHGVYYGAARTEAMRMQGRRTGRATLCGLRQVGDHAGPGIVTRREHVAVSGQRARGEGQRHRGDQCRSGWRARCRRSGSDRGGHGACPPEGATRQRRPVRANRRAAGDVLAAGADHSGSVGLRLHRTRCDGPAG
jgi:thioredoxin reductase (NADPH)